MTKKKSPKKPNKLQYDNFLWKLRKQSFHMDLSGILFYYPFYLLSLWGKLRSAGCWGCKTQENFGVNTVPFC